MVPPGVPPAVVNRISSLPALVQVPGAESPLGPPRTALPTAGQSTCHVNTLQPGETRGRNAGIRLQVGGSKPLTKFMDNQELRGPHQSARELPCIIQQDCLLSYVFCHQIL